MEMEQEEYIDLQDLDIIDEELDENYNPSDEEILAYAEYLGFDNENDQELLVIAYQALKTPLPDNWKRAIIKNSQEVLYINLDDQTLHTYSPIDEAAILHYREQKELLIQNQNQIKNHNQNQNQNLNINQKQHLNKNGRENFNYNNNFDNNNFINNNNSNEIKIIPRAKNLPPIGSSKEKDKDKDKEKENYKKKKSDKLNMRNLNFDKRSIDSSEYIPNRQNSNFIFIFIF